MFSQGEINGHPAFWLENETLKASVLPQKGADIYELIYKPPQVDFLLKTPGGLGPPAAEIDAVRRLVPSSLRGYRPANVDFLENYEGGWQELFPNPGDAVAYSGQDLPFHGLAALLPWQLSGVSEEGGVETVSLCLDLPSLSFRLERRMRLLPDRPVLEVQSTVVNLAKTDQEFLWGHHIVLGGPFLRAGCRVEMPDCTIYTPEALYEPETALLAPGQRRPWPFASTNTPPGLADLRDIPGPAAHTHDDIFLSDMREGWLNVTNPDLGLTFRLEWDPLVFGCIVNWRPFGGADRPPLTGIYGMGIEPWVSRHNLNEAISQQEALSLGPGEILTTSLQVVILDGTLARE